MLEYKTYDGKTFTIPKNEYNKGVIAMLELICEEEQLEVFKDKYFKLFYKDIL